MIKKTILNSGSRVLLAHFYFSNDGEDKELNNHNLINPQDYDPFADVLADPKTKLIICQVWHSFSDFDGLLSFDYTSPVPSWNLTSSTGPHVDFRHFGGLADRYQPEQGDGATDRTGVVLFTTKGFAEAGAKGTMIIEFKKSKVA